MATIAERAGVSRQTVYEHFPNVDAIVREAYVNYRDRVTSHILHRVDPTAPLGQMLPQLVDALFDENFPEHSQLQLEIASYLARATYAEQWFDEPLLRLLAAAVGREQQAGRVLPALATEEVAQIFLTTLAGFLLIASEPLKDRARKAHRALQILLKGVTA